MRLEPVSRPRGLWVRLLFLGSRWMFGRVLAPFAVLYARMPGFVRPQIGMVRFVASGLSLPPRLRALVEVHVSRANGCGFCGDLHEWDGRRNGIAPEDFAALVEPEGASRFDEPTRAALAYAAAVARRAVDDAVFARARASWDERAVVELTFVAAWISYLNLMAGALGLESEGLCAIPPRVTRDGGRTIPAPP